VKIPKPLLKSLFEKRGLRKASHFLTDCSLSLLSRTISLREIKEEIGFANSSSNPVWLDNEIGFIF